MSALVYEFIKHLIFICVACIDMKIALTYDYYTNEQTVH